MSAENEVLRLKPAFIKDDHTIPRRKRRLLGTRNDVNQPLAKARTSRGCFNCTHNLSKYYYWKPSPCDKCFRNPSNSCWFLKPELADFWQQLMNTSFSRRNQLL